MPDVIICEQRTECRDDNVNRWYCHADRAGICPLKRCGGPGMDHEIRRQSNG